MKLPSLSNPAVSGAAWALENAVVVKPAVYTPVTGGLLLAKIFEEAGLPAGLVNVVISPAEEIGDVFTLHPVPRMISFTGSTRVGRRVGALAMTEPRIKRVVFELGGNVMMPTWSMLFVTLSSDDSCRKVGYA
ncbi:aldehyde dehydrogenase family protein [Pseudomonas tolaasii]